MQRIIDETKFQAIRVLNEMLEADPEATLALVNHRVPCNEALAQHPTIQVGTAGDGAEKTGLRVGLLGIVNGIVGVSDDGSGFICVYGDVDEATRRMTRIDRFALTDGKGNVK